MKDIQTEEQVLKEAERLFPDDGTLIGGMASRVQREGFLKAWHTARASLLEELLQSVIKDRSNDFDEKTRNCLIKGFEFCMNEERAKTEELK